MELDLFALKIYMADKKYDRHLLAQKANLSESTINAYFQKRINPSLLSLGNIADALDVDVSKIVKHSE